MDSLGLVAKENEIKAKMTLFPSRKKKNAKVASHFFLHLNLYFHNFIVFFFLANVVSFMTFLA